MSFFPSLFSLQPLPCTPFPCSHSNSILLSLWYVFCAVVLLSRKKVEGEELFFYLVLGSLRAFATGTNKCCWNLNERCHLRSVPCLGTPFYWLPRSFTECLYFEFTVPQVPIWTDLFSNPRLMGLGQLYTIKWLAEYCKLTKEWCLNTRVPNYSLQWEMYLASIF